MIIESVSEVDFDKTELDKKLFRNNNHKKIKKNVLLGIFSMYF